MYEDSNLETHIALCCARIFVTPWTVAPPGSSVHGILQARTQERVAKPSSRGSSRPRDPTTLQADSLPAEPPGKPGNLPDHV